MKKFLYSLVIFLSLTSYENSKAIINTSVPDITSCPNKLVIVPVVVENIEYVSWIILHLDYNVLNGAPVPGVLSYVGFQNMHPALNGLMSVTNSGNTVIMSWYQGYLIDIPDDTLVELKFYYTSGTSELNWVTGGVSKYWGYTCGTLPANFINGSVDLSGLPPTIVNQPGDSTVYSGEECRFTVSALNALVYSWKLSVNGGFTWLTLADTGSYSGTGSNELIISDVEMYMNNYYYKCYLGGACQPYQYTYPSLLTVTPQVKTSLPNAEFCQGEIIVPVNVEDFYNVADFSLELEYDNSVMLYNSYYDPDPGLSGGILNVFDNNGQITLSWTGPSPGTINRGTLLDLKFTSVISDTLSDISWDTLNQGACYFNNASGNEIASSFSDGIVTIDECANINGKVYYDNSLSPGMDNVKVLLIRNGIMLDSTVTDSYGVYSFFDVRKDTYIISAEKNNIWGGANANDALMIAKHFTGMDTLSGLHLKAAEVDCSGYVNTTDALMVLQRFVGLIDSFPAGDMVFYPDTINVNDTTTIIIDIPALYSGDVNGSYMPGSF